ncbi:RPB5 subunit of DNA-directed RNA polymerase [Aulographum hederae CBS 113979]|uniref:DNA-directed RNA polymerases I, II, and III subunit RPABC1 n=1 Tax=Aulographum hederae CBS 113979 TaxID=1176131 RepID=A0A6G1GRY2_9PEZI|nr:RPB5 subunit of DNA-directed RNA polymerase [Aulographum hederae CBS 113979]
MDEELNAKEAHRMWRVLKNARQMCFDRGYELLEDELNISLDDFKSQFCNSTGEVDRGRMDFTCRPTEAMIAKYTDPPTARVPNPKTNIGEIHVAFIKADSVGVKHLKEFMVNCSRRNMATGIFISSASLSSAALKLIPTVLPLMIEVFAEQDLLVNIMQHVLVPKHVLLSKEEKIALLERYRLKETQLPRIQVNDPVARYLGLKRGHVVKIIRKSETAGRYASYRYCI